MFNSCFNHFSFFYTLNIFGDSYDARFLFCDMCNSHTFFLQNWPCWCVMNIIFVTIWLHLLSWLWVQIIVHRINSMFSCDLFTFFCLWWIMSLMQCCRTVKLLWKHTRWIQSSISHSTALRFLCCLFIVSGELGKTWTQHPHSRPLSSMKLQCSCSYGILVFSMKHLNLRLMFLWL